MIPKKVTLHRATADNVGGFHDAGATLTVGDDAKPGMIHSDRVRDLLATHGGIAHKPAETTAGKASPSKRKTSGKPMPKSQPAPVVPPVEQVPASQQA